MQRRAFMFIWLLPVMNLFSPILSCNARAEGIDLRTEFSYTGSDSKATNKTTGEASTSEFSAFNQRYNLDISKTLYPYLTFVGGTLYELESFTFTSQETETETEERILRPFVGFNLNNPIYKAGVEYRKTEIEQETTGIPTTEDFRDEFNAILGFRSVGLPELNLRYTQTHTYDDPETVDSIDKLLTFDTRYTLWKELRFDYFYTRNERENRIRSFETLAQSHSGKIDYSRGFLNRRISMNTGYRIRYSTLEFPGVEAVESALFRSAGLSTLDDTPEDGPALNLTTALVDGNLTASSGIDIGLAGDEMTLTNMALDFGFPVNVNRIRIWVDRRLSSSVANSFSWSVYTSPDNMDTSAWTLSATVFPGSFGIFENRFELSFSAVNTRFIKIVTRPLLPSVSDAPNFPNIFVTEIQAFTTPSRETVQKKETTVDHNYNLNLRGRLTDKTLLGYNLYYSLQERDPASEKRTELSNDIYLSHIFNKVFSASTRLSRTDSELRGEESVRYTYGSTIKADYLETFGQTLTYSGTQVTEEAGSSSTNSLLLRNNAKLYRGWSAFLDMGYGWNNPLESTRTTSTIVRSGTNFVPNQKLTVNMNYSFTTTTRPEEENGETSRSQLDLRAFFIPFRALSLNARLSIVDREDSKTTLQNYSVNWSPFPDGALQFFFTYSETLRPEEEKKERTIGPSLKWTISRHAFLDMSYNTAMSESQLLTTDSNSFNANLRIIF